MDGGREFYLTLRIQEVLSDKRSRFDIHPYQQTHSEKVKVSMTLKKHILSAFRYLIAMIDFIFSRIYQYNYFNLNRSKFKIKLSIGKCHIGHIDTECKVYKFCKSNVMCKVAEYGLAIVVRSNTLLISGLHNKLITMSIFVIFPINIKNDSI